MPAGDAGLERQTLSERVRERLAVAHMRIDDVLSDRDAASFHEILDNTKDMAELIDQLLAQLAVQQAVVDAARDYRQSVIDMMHVMETGGDAWRMARERRVNAESRMFSGLAALDKAQAAQPEGEQAG